MGSLSLSYFVILSLVMFLNVYNITALTAVYSGHFAVTLVFSLLECCFLLFLSYFSVDFRLKIFLYYS